MADAWAAGADRRRAFPGRDGARGDDVRIAGCRLCGDNASIIAALVLFFAAIFAGVPVGFVLLLAAAAYMWASGAATLVVLPQTMVERAPGTSFFSPFPSSSWPD